MTHAEKFIYIMVARLYYVIQKNEYIDIVLLGMVLLVLYN